MTTNIDLYRLEFEFPKTGESGSVNYYGKLYPFMVMCPELSKYNLQPGITNFECKIVKIIENKNVWI